MLEVVPGGSSPWIDSFKEAEMRKDLPERGAPNSNYLAWDLGLRFQK